MINKTKLLSREQINNIPIIDNSEVLIEAKETERLKISHKYTGVFLVREKVYKMLLEAANRLPDNYTLIFIEGFRSKEGQQKIWDEAVEKIKKENSDASSEEIEKIVRLGVAKPTGKGGHQTGGAVDVSLGDNQENELEILGPQKFIPDKSFTFSENISKEEKELRKILYSTMTKSGFQNYPAEWWHYSYGDQLWAAYGKFKTAFYGHL